MLYQIKTKTFPWHSHLLSLNIETIGCQNQLVKNMQLILGHKNLLCCTIFFKFCTDFLLRNHNSNLCSDHTNKINVLPQYAVSLYCSNFPELKQSKQSSYFRCLCHSPISGNHAATWWQKLAADFSSHLTNKVERKLKTLN